MISNNKTKSAGGMVWHVMAWHGSFGIVLRRRQQRFLIFFFNEDSLLYSFFLAHSTLVSIHLIHSRPLEITQQSKTHKNETHTQKSIQ
jgi:hypothetical protein